jgi:hypothetical protein
MPRMKILNSVEREVFDFPPIFNSVESARQTRLHRYGWYVHYSEGP